MDHCAEHPDAIHEVVEGVTYICMECKHIVKCTEKPKPPEQSSGSDPKPSTSQTSCGKVMPSDTVLMTGLETIANLGKRIRISKHVISSAMKLFEQLHGDDDYMNGTPRKVLAPTCLYLASRIVQATTTAREIEAASGEVDRVQISDCFYYIIKILGVDPPLLPLSRYIYKFCAKLKLPTYVEHHATKVANKVERMELCKNGNIRRLEMACAAIYMVGFVIHPDCRRSKEEIGKASGESPEGIQKAYLQMKSCAPSYLPEIMQLPGVHNNLPES